MIKYSELVKKTMPPEKRATASKCIIGHYLVRPISNILSIPLIEKEVDPTSVTICSAIFPLIALGGFIFFEGDLGFYIGWISIFLWNILDGIDGNIARYCNKCSKRGELWDATIGWLAMIAFYFGMGMTAYYNPGYIPFGVSITPVYFVIMGFVASMAWIFPRLVMQKKIVISGLESVNSVKDRANYNFSKLVFFNITSINGGAAVVFLIAYLFNLNAICMISYFVLSSLVMIGSLYSLMKKDK